MTDPRISKLLETFTLNPQQHQAAVARGCDVVATAGAGSGKTLTLVARYTSLLAEGIPPRRIAAITFSIKAAREMRARVRKTLFNLQNQAASADERQAWAALSAQMDAARISTIHSLCAEILRAHPAEAAIDPRFDIIDEGLSAALRVQAVEDTLKAMVENEQFLPLLTYVATYHLQDMLKDLLNRRLEAREAFSKQVEPGALLTEVLHTRLNHPAIKAIIDELRGMSQGALVQDGGDKLAEMVHEMLRLWEHAERALGAGDLMGCALVLYQARRVNMNLSVGKRDSWVKAQVKTLRNHFDQLINPLTGGATAKDEPPSEVAEARFSELIPLLRAAYEILCQTYQDLLDARQALDFDDLEQRAVQLLRDEAIRARWQAELDAILVDEFQDTNRRQQDIIEALAGSPGRLFIVGDMRQSIYRFRQADVTVFKYVQDRIRAEQGQVIDLPLTYRAHEPLLLATGDLLSGAIGTQPDPACDYYVPYTPMQAFHKHPHERTQPPHVELVFGAGENAETARLTTARALAIRLRQLMQTGQIKTWDEVALLFRASTGYADYETALEEMGIPFVTVAGRGFYDRPEIRDLINILRALADPLDDLAFAGLLRSPAFGLTDAALFQLRQSGLPYWQALQGDLAVLSSEDQQQAQKTLETLEMLLPLVDRIPVAELLSKIVNATHYRAILATADARDDTQDASATGGRLWRNLDKLLADALASDELQVRNFLEMLETLNDAGAREGEASAEAQGSVQLMTIHKAKGLEFNVVVLAAASRRTRTAGELLYLFEQLGVAFKLDPVPMLYKLATHMEKDQEEKEQLRLLYVALTRAKQKLIISGHAKTNKDGVLSFDAWAGKLVAAAGLTAQDVHQAGHEPFEFPTASNHPLRVWCLRDDDPQPAIQFTPGKIEAHPVSKQPPLYKPIDDHTAKPPEEDQEPVPDPSSWRASAHDENVTGKVLGQLVHKALEHWHCPQKPGLAQLLETEALQAGLVQENQRTQIIQQALDLLTRLRQHPLWARIEAAEQRYHELPYTMQSGSRIENRYIDLLFEDDEGWQMIEFKTDPIQTTAYKEELVVQYAHQVQRYQQAVRQLLGISARAYLCFLDDQGEVALVEVD